MSIVLKKSTRKGKKWMVIIKYNDSASQSKGYGASQSKGHGASHCTIHFGANGYEDYTMHSNVLRKQRYITRHASREDWSIHGICTAGFWSRWLLWNKPTLKDSIKDTEKKFKIKIVMN